MVLDRPDPAAGFNEDHAPEDHDPMNSVLRRNALPGAGKERRFSRENHTQEWPNEHLPRISLGD